MKEFPRKFLSLRDKSSEHHRSKSAPPANKAHPLSAEAFRSIFKPDHAKQTHQNEVDAAREVAKVCCAVFSAMSTSERLHLDPNKH
ncbi:hypothetical protein V8C34DRAFT_279235 [Trichoderma compactum]